MDLLTEVQRAVQGLHPRLDEKDLRVESEPGRGAAFGFSLPAGNAERT